MPATTPVYALPYPAAADPADVPADMQALANQVAKILGGALSATPPASPIEGQLWAMSPATGVVWVFRYNAAAASNKWEFVGGPPLAAATVTGTIQTSADNAWQHPASAPTLTLARAGDYRASYGGNILLTQPGHVWLSCGFGTTPIEPLALFDAPSLPAGTSWTLTAESQGLLSGSGTLNWLMQSGAGGPGNVAVTRSILSVTPIRVT